MANVKPLTSIDLFYSMRDEDFIEVIEMGAIESFCNQLTLDFHELSSYPIYNKA